MRPVKGPTEGPGPDLNLIELFQQFEELCEIEGSGAADEGDLCRLRHGMTEAFTTGNVRLFLDRLAKAMSLRDGDGFDSPGPFSH
jgi:hypothetical protein